MPTSPDPPGALGLLIRPVEVAGLFAVLVTEFPAHILATSSLFSIDCDCACVWLGYNKPRPPLPPTITSLFVDWKSSDTRTKNKRQT
eukprot:scaffold509_cov74-Cyclotella_meneghiniana.AAC.2